MHRKKTVIYSHQLDAHFLCGVGDCDNEVLEYLSTFLKSDARPAMSCGLQQDEKSKSFFSEPLLKCVRYLAGGGGTELIIHKRLVRIADYVF